MFESIYEKFLTNINNTFNICSPSDYTHSDISSILDGFDSIHLKKGYTLGSYCHLYTKGGIFKFNDNWTTAIYAHLKDAKKIYKDNFETIRYISRNWKLLNMFYKENMILEGALYSDRFVKAMPNLFSSIDVDFTPEGIAQAYFIFDHEAYLPCMWHAAYERKHILVNNNIINKLPPVYQKKVHNIPIGKPSITIKDNHAELSFTFFSTGKGICSYKVSVLKINNTVKFISPIIKEIFEDNYPTFY